MPRCRPVVLAPAASARFHSLTDVRQVSAAASCFAPLFGSPGRARGAEGFRRRPLGRAPFLGVCGPGFGPRRARAIVRLWRLRGGP
eukprot:100395-Lingulodinium_polyedra.AAC.1